MVREVGGSARSWRKGRNMINILYKINLINKKYSSILKTVEHPIASDI